MGNFIKALQLQMDESDSILSCNLIFVKEPVSRVRELHQGFKMLSDSFAIGLKEFEQIFSMSEAVFSVWDHDANGLIDCIEFFTGMIVFSNGRVEDKLRFLIELYDFNEQGFLQHTELHFMVFNIINSCGKVFGLTTQTVDFTGSNGQEAYNLFQELLRMTFPPTAQLGSKELLRWVVESPELRNFFAFIDKVNEQLKSK